MNCVPRWRSISRVLVFTCLIAGASRANAGDLIGKGEWESSSGAAMRGTWTATLLRSGTNLAGDIALSGSPLFAGGEVSGTMEGDAVVLGVLTGGAYQATFKGNLTDGKIAGEWDFPAIGDHGNWSGTLQSGE